VFVQAKDRTRRYHEDANTRCKKAAISFYSGQRMPLAAGSTESDMQVVPEIAEVYLGGESRGETMTSASL
jgi:hypothetical protein